MNHQVFATEITAPETLDDCASIFKNLSETMVDWSEQSKTPLIDLAVLAVQKGGPMYHLSQLIADRVEGINRSPVNVGISVSFGMGYALVDAEMLRFLKFIGSRDKITNEALKANAEKLTFVITARAFGRVQEQKPVLCPCALCHMLWAAYCRFEHAKLDGTELIRMTKSREVADLGQQTECMGGIKVVRYMKKTDWGRNLPGDPMST